MEEKLSIKIKIADREYRMQTEQSMEEKLRSAGKLLNEKLKEYSKKLGVQDKQDLLAMASFDCIVELLSFQENARKSHQLVVTKIENLDELLSSSL